MTTSTNFPAGDDPLSASGSVGQGITALADTAEQVLSDAVQDIGVRFRAAVRTACHNRIVRSVLDRLNSLTRSYPALSVLGGVIVAAGLAIAVVCGTRHTR